MQGLLILHGVGSEVIEVAVLLVSELVANAVVHSCSRHGEVTVLLKADRERGRIRLDVIDDGPAVSVRAVHKNQEHEGGRGLLLVEELADRWGCYPDEDGTGVWFELESSWSTGCRMTVVGDARG
ncbi:hypothetical protein Ssi02_59910 [Sinosporangium siamense]|uniref:Histidine kinase/HSP90-like ATPase domain-containing protein n=1 Tax=Sinosporangium siamense TaxID=1367973 RepID=A0A919V839_9ACTN|nr:hypothetical protein Ssi02_59910 [Sinosporangium siamense]